MDDKAILLKTYAGDYAYYSNLIDSFRKYNVDNIKMYVVVPRKDKRFLVDDENVCILEEEQFAGRIEEAGKRQDMKDISYT